MRQAHRSPLVPALLVLVLTLAACGGQGDEESTGEVAESDGAGDDAAEGTEAEETEGGADAPAGDSVLRLAVHEPPDALDPATIYGNRSIQIAQNMYDGLVMLDENLEIAPAIAESWEINDDATVYTFHLREDVTFSNGDPVTAEDFVYSINRSLDPDIGNPHLFMMDVIKGAPAVIDGETDEAEGVRATDEFTLEIEMERPAGYFLALATTWPYWVVSSSVVEEHGDEWMMPPNQVGTGPYQLVDQTTDELYVFEANEDYFRGAPDIERIEVSVVPEASTQMARYEAGEFDAIYNIAPADLLRVESEPELQEQFGSQSMMAASWLSMLYSEEPFDDHDVRMAFNHAIDTEELVEVALEGQGAPAHTFLPPGMPGNLVEEREPYDFDPELARQYLADAGFPDGEGFPELAIHFNATTENQAVFEVVQNQLNENLNINVGLESMPAQAYSALIQEPPENRPLLSRGNMGADYPDPQEFQEFLATCEGFHNRENFCHPEFDDIVLNAIGLPDQDERMELHSEAENLYLDEAPLVPLYYPLTTWLARPHVENYGFNPLYMREWWDMSLTS